MAKKTVTQDDVKNLQAKDALVGDKNLSPDDPEFVPGRWYMFTAPGGFTLYGRYVRPLGVSRHRFEHVVYQMNGGGRTLPEICKSGPHKDGKYSAPFPGYWNGIPITSADYFGDTPWVKS